MSRGPHRARMRNGQRSEISKFYTSRFEPSQLAEASDRTKSNYAIAINHFSSLLERPANVADLSNTETLCGLLSSLTARGFKPATVIKTRSCLWNLASSAHSSGLIGSLPQLPAIHANKEKPTAWSLPELNRLIGSARTMPGLVCDVPARLWWPSLLLLLLNVGGSAESALTITKAAFDRQRARLAVGMLVHSLHVRTFESLEQIDWHQHDQLIPWDKDGGKPPFHMLYREFKTVLFRADLPVARANMFDRLRVTVAKVPTVLDLIDFQTPFKPRSGTPKIPRTRDRQQQVSVKTPPVCCCLDPVILRTNCEDDLTQFLERRYLKKRSMKQAAKSTIDALRRTVSSLNEFTGHTVGARELSDEMIEDFLLWISDRGVVAQTVNGYRANILALWRLAWKKRLTNEQPRDIEKYPATKRVPEAWSIDQMSALITAAYETPGEVCGIAAGVWWSALILSLYDTGLRIGALMDVRADWLDMKTGWIKVPAESQKQNADQVFRLHGDTLGFFAAMPSTREMLLPWPFGVHGPLTRRLRLILKRAGLPTTRRDLFHKLRRTSGSHLAAETTEGEAVKHLGHSGIQVTRVYLDPRIVRKVHAADVIPRPIIHNTSSTGLNASGSQKDSPPVRT